MAEELLDRSDVVAVLEEVGGEAVPEGVTGRALAEARVSDRLGDGALEDGLVEMVATEAAVGGAVAAVRGEHPLPAPGSGRVEVLLPEAVGKLDEARARVDVSGVLGSDLLEVLGERAGGASEGERARKGGRWAPPARRRPEGRGRARGLQSGPRVPGRVPSAARG